MNVLTGYTKGTLSDNYLLSAAGGHIPLGNSSGSVPLSNNTLNTDLFADKARTLPYFTIPSNGELSKDPNDATKLIPKYIKIGTINIPLTSWYRGSIMLIFHDYEIYKLNGDILMILCTTSGNKVGALPAIRWKTKHDKSTEDSIILSKVDDNTYDLYLEAKFSWMTFYVYYLTKEKGVFNFNVGLWSLVEPNPITTRSTLLNVSSEALTLSPEYVGNLNDVARDTFIDGRFLATNTPYSNYFTGISLSNSELKYKYLFGFSTTGIPFVRYNNNSTWLPWKLLAFTSDISSLYVTLTTDLTITGLKTFESNSSTTGVSLILKNKGWAGSMQTAMDFYNGSNYTVPNARISTLMNGSGSAGGTLIFYTQTKASANPNPNGLVERFRIGDDNTSNLTGDLTVDGKVNDVTIKKLFVSDTGDALTTVYNTLNVGTDYVLASIRYAGGKQSVKDPWLANNYSAGIGFGGMDTKGALSLGMYSPNIKFAAADRNSGWWLLLTGTSYTSYNLDLFTTLTKTNELLGDYLPRQRMKNPDHTTSEIGGIPFNVLALKAAGTPLYDDPEFFNGINSVKIYNNKNNTNVSITHIDDNLNSANSSGKIIQISSKDGEIAPGRGGFYQLIKSRKNAIFVQIFRAKIPLGYKVVNAENSMGAGYNTYWLTDLAGTGKWEWYCRVTLCGTADFSTGGHVFLEKTDTNALDAVTWYLSYCNAFDLSKGNYDGLKTKLADSVAWSGITNKPTSFAPSDHASSLVTSLSGYSKATSASDLATTDTLNAALGKLEYKSDYAYDWIINVTATDTDEYINKWGEIVGFLDSMKEGTDILDLFVTRKTDQSITGVKTFDKDVWFAAGNDDKYITFSSSTSPATAGTNSWRIGYIGSGSGDANNLVLQSNKGTTDTWDSALSISNVYHVATFAGNVISPSFISGSGTNDFSAGVVKLDTLHIPTTNNGTTYGIGSQGLILRTNGGTVYWDTITSLPEYKSLSRNSYTTVKATKDLMKVVFSDIPSCIGAVVNVPYQTIQYWDNEDFVYNSGATYSAIKLSAGYSGNTYGLWLLSSYGDQRLYYVGLNNGEWTPLRKIATESDGKASASIANGKIVKVNVPYTSDYLITIRGTGGSRCALLYVSGYGAGGTSIRITVRVIYSHSNFKYYYNESGDSIGGIYVKNAFTGSEQNDTIYVTSLNKSDIPTITSVELIPENAVEINSSECNLLTLNTVSNHVVTLGTNQTITGTKTFNDITLNCGLNIRGTNPITWHEGTHRQRIQTTDDSNTNTNLFEFQQSKDTGATWESLFTIKDNGHVVATKFVGEELSVTGNISTSNGYLISTHSDKTISIGSDNSSFCHYITTADNHYFNKTLYVNGSIMPYDTTKNLGSDANRWANLFSKGVNTQTLTVSGNMTVKRDPSVIIYHKADGTCLGYLGFILENKPCMYKSDGATNYPLVYSLTYSDSTYTKTPYDLLLENYDSMPTNVVTPIYLSHGSASMAIGYRINHTYKYGGWFGATYNEPWFVSVYGDTWLKSTLIHSNNYLNYLGYVGTTAVQKTSAILTLTGISGITFSGGNEYFDQYGNFHFGTAGTTWGVYHNDSSVLLKLTKSTGLVEAKSFKVTGGTYSQFLKADGSVDSNTYLTASSSIPDTSITWSSTGLSGLTGPVSTALCGPLKGNRFAGIKAEAVSIEYSRDAGATWYDYEVAGDYFNSLKRYFFNLFSASFILGKNSDNTTSNDNYRLRVTVDCNIGQVYSELKKAVLYVTTNNSNNCTVTVLTSNNNTTYTDRGTYYLNGWSGYNEIPLVGITADPSARGGAYSRYIRFLFSAKYVASDSAYVKGLTIMGIEVFGGVGWTTPNNHIAKYGRPYTFDYLGLTLFYNTVYPAANNSYNLGSPERKWYAIYASSFIGNVTGNATTATTASNVIVGSGSTNAYRAIVVHNGNALYSAGTTIGKPCYNYSTGDIKAKSFTTDGGLFIGAVTSVSNISSAASSTGNLAITLSGLDITTSSLITLKLTSNWLAPVDEYLYLNINSNGNKPIKLNGSNVTLLNAGTYTFLFDGANYNIVLTSYTTYGIATASKAGLVKPNSVITKPTINTVSTTAGKYYHILMSSDGNMFVNVPWEKGSYTLPLAANGTRGGIQIGYSESGTNYAVKLSSEKAYVTVPWTDTKVKQTAKSDNIAYPLLLSPNGHTSGNAGEAYYDSGVTLNPSTNTIAANVTGSSGSCTGNAATATCIKKPGSPITALPTSTTTLTAGITMGIANSATTNKPTNTTYGNVIQIGGQGHAQLFMEWSGSSTPTTGKVYYNSKRDIEGTAWGGWVLLIDERDTVTTSKAGLMSAADKTKLDSITGSVANNLVIKLNNGTAEGTNLFTFNGSEAKTINITPTSINALASNGTASASIRLSSKGDNTNANTLCFYSASISSTTLSAMNSWTRPTDGSNNAMVLRMYKTANTGHDIYAASDKDSLWHRNSSNATSKWAKILDSENCYGVYQIMGNLSGWSIGYTKGKNILGITGLPSLSGTAKFPYFDAPEDTIFGESGKTYLITSNPIVVSASGMSYAYLFVGKLTSTRLNLYITGNPVDYIPNSGSYTTELIIWEL